MINHLENGNRGLSHKWLVRLATALGTSPGWIIDHNPNTMSRDLFDIWNRGDENERAKLVSVAEALIPYRAQPRNF
jgi:plasmid maintenance system antidote protein VapI